MRYHFQLVTRDFYLQISTECQSDSLDQLLYQAKSAVSSNPNMIGEKYRIFDQGRMVKEDIIQGI